MTGLGLAVVVTGYLTVGVAAAVLGVYAVAVLRRCVRWSLGLHVVLVASSQVGLVLVATIGTQAIPEAAASDWRSVSLVTIFAVMLVSLVVVLRHTRERVSEGCTRHERGSDYWHDAPPRLEA